MSVSIYVDDELYEAARYTAKAECRTIVNQLEFWAKVGKLALENPDLTVEFVQPTFRTSTQLVECSRLIFMPAPLENTYIA